MVKKTVLAAAAITALGTVALASGAYAQERHRTGMNESSRQGGMGTVHGTTGQTGYRAADQTRFRGANAGREFNRGMGTRVAHTGYGERRAGPGERGGFGYEARGNFHRGTRTEFARTRYRERGVGYAEGAPGAAAGTRVGEVTYGEAWRPGYVGWGWAPGYGYAGWAPGYAYGAGWGWTPGYAYGWGAPGCGCGYGAAAPAETAVGVSEVK